VARLNGISRDKPGWLSSWQHSTIARRVEFLQDVLRDPSLERRFQWRVALVKFGLFVGLVGALVGLLYVDAKEREAPVTPPAATQGTADAVTPHTAGHTAPLE